MNTAIEWTDETWNPVTGCTKVSSACDFCYAETMHERFHGKGSLAEVTLHPERLEEPLRWRKHRKVFVNSMADLYHESIPTDFLARVFAVMASAAAHDFQILTKRHGRMRSLLRSDAFREDVIEHYEDVTRLPLSRMQRDPSEWWPLPNVWLGVSVENQKWADVRVPALLDTVAAVRFLSCEPLLGPVDLTPHMPVTPYWDPRGTEEWGVDWVIVGGESGPHARPMHQDWARSLRDQCVDAGTAFFFKQWGEWAPAAESRPGRNGRRRVYLRADGVEVALGDSGESSVRLDRVGKKAAGRELDGQTWDEYPSVEGEPTR